MTSILISNDSILIDTEVSENLSELMAEDKALRLETYVNDEWTLQINLIKDLQSNQDSNIQHILNVPISRWEARYHV